MEKIVAKVSSYSWYRVHTVELALLLANVEIDPGNLYSYLVVCFLFLFFVLRALAAVVSR